MSILEDMEDMKSEADWLDVKRIGNFSRVFELFVNK